ncbi:hypothetical protein BLL36_08510 [Pseudomonas cedrina subsp. cedrina]|uniref:Uncharacterized protein n=1 Tax=Pseudomonas cedrina subsp. cedrina TaxID=76762 RepID=A0A1V2KC46_PSECE|nr:hypothetical protein BLL36_08510 [Pseudomonas cedrina subsp. cedrina]
MPEGIKTAVRAIERRWLVFQLKHAAAGKAQSEPLPGRRRDPRAQQLQRIVIGLHEIRRQSFGQAVTPQQMVRIQCCCIGGAADAVNQCETQIKLLA